MIKISYSARDLSLSECMHDKWKINICLLYAVVVVKHDFAPVDRADLLGTMDVAATSMKRAFDRSVHNAGFVFAVIKISRSCELSR